LGKGGRDERRERTRVEGGRDVEVERECSGIGSAIEIVELEQNDIIYTHTKRVSVKGV